MTARKLANYPPEFAEAFRRAQQGTPVHIACGSKEEARRVRRRLYQYRAGLMADPAFDAHTTLAAGDLELVIADTAVVIQRKDGANHD